jgi:hypothetical protein
MVEPRQMSSRRRVSSKVASPQRPPKPWPRRPGSGSTSARAAPRAPCVSFESALVTQLGPGKAAGTQTEADQQQTLAGGQWEPAFHGPVRGC